MELFSGKLAGLLKNNLARCFNALKAFNEYVVNASLVFCQNSKGTKSNLGL